MTKEAAVVLANAVIWALVIIASSMALKGTEQFQEIHHILGGGAGSSFLVVSLVVIKRAPQR